MPALDAADDDSAAVGSVLSQSGAELEVVVQDGGSQDETLAILERIADPRITVESRPDSGLGSALNRALARAKGDWVVWLNADDLMMPGAIEGMAPHLSGSAGVLCGDFARIDA